MFWIGDGQARFVKSIELYNRGAYQFNNQHWGRAYLQFRRATMTCIGRAPDVGGFYRAAAERELNDAALRCKFHRRALEFYKRGVTAFPDPEIFRAISREYEALATLSCDVSKRQQLSVKAGRYAVDAGRQVPPPLALMPASFPRSELR